MTKVKYDIENYAIEISGHAGAGEAGQDLVCAAATILMRTLEAAVIDEQIKLRPAIYKRDGYARIQCEPAPRAKTKCNEIYRTIYLGYEQLSRQYPEYVKAYEV